MWCTSHIVYCDGFWRSSSAGKPGADDSSRGGHPHSVRSGHHLAPAPSPRGVVHDDPPPARARDVLVIPRLGIGTGKPGSPWSGTRPCLQAPRPARHSLPRAHVRFSSGEASRTARRSGRRFSRPRAGRRTPGARGSQGGGAGSRSSDPSAGSPPKYTHSAPGSLSSSSSQT